MPSVTLPTPADKSIVRQAIPNAKIFTAAVARLMVAFPDPERWSYTGLWGAATLCKEKNAYYIRLIDIEHHKGVQWEQELDTAFEFVQECPFFFTFDTDDCLAGLEFVDQGEGATFYSKLIHRESIPLKGESAERNKINKASIGPPADFRHKAHIGWSTDHDIADQLKALGITSKEIERNEGFIHEFLSKFSKSHEKRRKRAPSTPLPPTPHSPALQTNAKEARPKVPPPPPPRRSPRPPPLPARHQHLPSPTAPPPPPPPPPQQIQEPNQPQQLQKPQKPQHEQQEQQGHHHLTPEPNQGGRADLMASIRHTGGFGSLKQGGRLRSSSEHVPATTTKKEPDMVSSLAAAIQQRKMAMGNEEEQSSDDDDEWA